jgi:hypothetical protein
MREAHDPVRSICADAGDAIAWMIATSAATTKRRTAAFREGKQRT